MAEYQAFHCLETGFSHLKTGCEDYAGSESRDGIRIATISDGHGDKACLRSHLGSRFAVEIAIENMGIFAERLRELNRQQDLLDPRKREILLRQLIRSIIGKWNIRVLKNLEEEPLTEEELSVQHRYSDAYRQGRHLSHIFGCTLIAAMIVDDYLIVLHHGDGRCVVLHQDGTADQPVPWDEMCIGNVTTSVCQPDAVERCRYYVCDLKKDAVVGCFVTSDGIEDSLEDLPDQNALCAYFSNMAARVARDGVDAVKEAMKKELPIMSQFGSRDDTSFGALLDVEAAGKMAERLSLVYEMYSYSAEAQRMRQKLNSMQRKMDVLRKDVEQAEEDCSAAENSRKSLSRMMEEIRKQLTQLVQRHEDSIERQKTAEERLEKARSAFEEYNATHESYESRGRQAREKVEELRHRLEELMHSRQEEQDAQEEPPVPEIPEEEIPTEMPEAEIPGADPDSWGDEASAQEPEKEPEEEPPQEPEEDEKEEPQPEPEEEAEEELPREPEKEAEQEPEEKPEDPDAGEGDPEADQA